MAVRSSALFYLLGVIPVFALPGIVIAQENPTSAGNAATVQTNHVAPIYDSADNANRATPFRFGSPEDNARPGEHYFGLAVDAIKHKDFAFAIDMYKVAASWAYKPAEYNLAVMYARGQGTRRSATRHGVDDVGGRTQRDAVCRSARTDQCEIERRSVCAGRRHLESAQTQLRR